MHGCPPLVLSKAPLQIGLGAFWTAYTSDQATWLGVALLVMGLAFFYFGIRIKTRTYKAQRRIGGTAGLLVFVTWALSALSTYFFFGLLGSRGGLVPSPVSPVTYGTAGVTFVAIALLTGLRNRGMAKVALLSALAGAVVGAMIFELPYLFIISPRIGLPVDRTLLAFSPLFCLVFASYTLLFLTPFARISRYTFFSLGALFVTFALWAFLTDFAFPGDPVSFVLNSATKVLSFAAAFTLFIHKNGPPPD